LESKKNIPEPEMTSEGKFRCRTDSQEYDNREDYESHCMEEHSSESSSDMTENME
jgi:hypothetical protein